MISSKVSIIIPVYNVEKYIKKCVESICAQTHQNIEILLIDDGSTDSSGIICDELKATDSRIIVIHKENNGVSSARNTGLEIMSGDYFTFVDSDDTVATDFIKTMLDAIVAFNADISTCCHKRIELDNTENTVKFIDDATKLPVVKTGIESITDMFYGKTCSASSGSKLYSSKMFNALRFQKLIMGEDTLFVYNAFTQANNIVHTDKPLYYYIQQETSVTNKKANYIKFYDYVKLYDYIINSDEQKYNKDFFYALVNRLIENNFWVYMKLRNCPDKYFSERKHIVENIKKYRKYVIKNQKSEIRVRLACLLSYGGMKLVDFIYDIKK